MEIHVSRNGQKFGPYKMAEVKSYLAAGNLQANDLAWYQGAAGWMPLYALLALKGDAYNPPQNAPLAVQNEQQPIATKAKRTPLLALGGAAGMGFMGFGCGFWLVIFGVLLSLTGIGAIIGIPLIIMGLSLPIVSAMFGLVTGSLMLKGKCPYCDSNITVANITGGIDCPACKKRLLMRNKKFVNVN